MNIIFYVVLFIIGSLIGALWAVKAREIPKSLDLKETFHSRNPKKQRIMEIIYILIGGISSALLANILKMDINKIDITKLVIYAFGMLYITTLVLVAGIDKGYLRIDKKVIAFGVVFSIIYMLYLFIIDLASIHINVIYLGIYIILLVIDSFLLRKFAKDSYIINLLILLNIILVFTNLRTLIYTVIMALIAIAIYVLISRMQKKKNGNKKIKINEIPVGFFIASSNVIILFGIRILENFLI